LVRRVRGDNRPDGDIDVLEPDTSFSVLNLLGVQQIIEHATGLPAEVTMRRSITPRFAERIADDVVEVF
jgi:predicted nucleotidyltransferase